MKFSLSFITVPRGEAAEDAAGAASAAAADQSSVIRPAPGAAVGAGAAAIPAASPQGPGVSTVTILLAVWLFALKSHALLDSIADTARDAAKSAAYTSAVSELASELKSGDDLAKASAALSRQTKTDDWSTAHLQDSLTYTNRFVSRARKLFLTLGLAGTDVATALNTAETNGALNEVIKNQQAELLLKQEEKAEEREEKDSWRMFIESERAARR